MDRAEAAQRIAFRRAALKELREAYLALVNGRAKSYTISDRTLTRLDLDSLAKEIRALEQELDELEAAASGNGRRKIIGIIPRDW